MVISTIIMCSIPLLISNYAAGLDNELVEKAKATVDSGKTTYDKAASVKETLSNGGLSMDTAKAALEGAKATFESGKETYKKGVETLEKLKSTFGASGDSNQQTENKEETSEAGSAIKDTLKNLLNF